MRKQLVTIAILVGSTPSYGDEVTYQRPPKAVAAFVDATPFPRAQPRPDRPGPRMSQPGPDRSQLVLATPVVFPPIAEVAEPELRLAGLRINPKNRAAARRVFAQRLDLLDAQAP